tara:strand:- start:17 stop:337 length:321 start_codon:yes stop_codon:yes gene_type:complete
MPRYHATVNGNVQFTAEEEAQWDTLQSNAIANRPLRKLAEIKEIRLQKLKETDWMGMSDYTMSDAWATKRQSWRDIPQNNNTEAEYDIILTRNVKGTLTNEIWSDA